MSHNQKQSMWREVVILCKYVTVISFCLYVPIQMSTMVLLLCFPLPINGQYLHMTEQLYFLQVENSLSRIIDYYNYVTRVNCIAL